MRPIEVAGYVVTDGFFGKPYLDVDEWREEPTAHRHLHGGFEGTDTRFAFLFPPAERYRGRLYQPLEGANAGHEDVYAGALGTQVGGLDMAFRLGGYMVESNMGHIGDVVDPKAGRDPTIYGWRAAAESARFSKYVAAQVLGSAPSFAYVFGGSGGARRSPLCLAYAPGVWNGALPYMGDARDGEHGDFRLLRDMSPNFACMFNVQRLLGPKIAGVIDAMAAGGSGDPFVGLTTAQREELANLYRIGYPRGDELMIAQPMGQMWLWASMAERLQAENPDYWKAFWTEPGHVGFDEPELVAHDLLDVRTTVRRPLRAKDLTEDPGFGGPEFAQLRGMATLFAGMHDMWEVPMALQLDPVPDGYRLGAGVRVLDGDAAGRQLYCISGVGDVLLCDGAGQSSNLRFGGVAPGDHVHVDNRAFLAYCYSYRHHLLGSPDYDFSRVDGHPVFRQYEQPERSPFMGTVHSAEYEGKLMWVHHTHDSSLWPPQGLGFKANVERVHGAGEASKRFRLRWTEHAEHVPPAMAASAPGRANNTWLIDYQPIIEQSLVDLADWVEKGIEPAGTNFSYADGKVTLPSAAKERGGIQPVVAVTADGHARTDVRTGQEVILEVEAEVPPGAGTIVSVEWDFDGTGTYPFSHDGIDGSAARVNLRTAHAWERPGTYFVTALVHAHRDGDPHASYRRIPNLAQARVVVT